MGANGVIAACYFAIAVLIFQGLVRGQQHLLKNPLVMATAAIFFTCALGHSAHILVMASQHHNSSPWMSIQVVADLLTAVVAVTYLTLRQQYSLLIDGPLFLAHTQNQLAATNAELAKVNANLECLVAERTQELHKTNERLKGEAADRAQLLAQEQAARQELRDALQKLSFHVENSPLAVMEWNPEFQLQRWSQQAEQIFGWKAAEVIGRHLQEWQFVFEDDSEQVNALTAGLTDGSQSRAVTCNRNYTKDGEVIYCEWYNSALLDESGNLVSVLSLVQDVSDRQRAESQIKELNVDLERRVIHRTAQLEATNKELEAFCYSVSHDLRTPLRSIDGFSLALLERYKGQLDDKGKHYLERLRAASQRMGQLIDDLLDLSRVTRSQMQYQTVDVSALVEAITAELQQAQPERPVELILTQGVVAQADPRLLRVVLENLLSNAWKFTVHQAQPRIEFGTTSFGLNDQSAPGMIKTNNQSADSKSSIAYFIRDNGAGFDMAYVDKLFKAFQRLHTTDEFPGDGIGLATVQRIINRHAGQVWAEGVPGQGATFYFTLKHNESAVPTDDHTRST